MVRVAERRGGEFHPRRDPSRPVRPPGLRYPRIRRRPALFPIIMWELAGWIEKRNRFIPFVVVKTLDATWLRTVGLVACDPMSRPMLNDFLNWMVFRQGRT